jgi:hypothetical protein
MATRAECPVFHGSAEQESNIKLLRRISGCAEYCIALSFEF